MRLAGIALFILGGCAQKVEVQALDDVTKIRVATNHDQALKTITAPNEISEIVQFINAHRRDWETPWAGVPVPTKVANLYKGEEFAGHFGVGEGFFEAQFDSRGFFSQPASEEERAEVLRLLDLQDAANGSSPRSVNTSCLSAAHLRQFRERQAEHL
jgi:hypothetical protein